MKKIDKDKLRAEKFSKNELEKLYKSLTKFRTLLTEDLGTRRNPIVKEGNDDP